MTLMRDPIAAYRPYTRAAYRRFPVCSKCANRFDPINARHWLWTGWCDHCGTDRLETLVRRVVTAPSAASRQAALKAIERLSTAASMRRKPSR
jgi:hydrogenase maturation factor HypF (carbamoyltransferase family)